MSEAYNILKQRYHNAHTINRIKALLTWDERVMMPPASGDERAHMFNLLSYMRKTHYLDHDVLVPLLEQAHQDMHLLPPWDQRNLQYMMDAHDDPPLNIVPNLRSDLRYAEAHCRQIWPAAKTHNQWSLIADHFSQLIYNRRILNTAIAAIRDDATPYDVSLSRYSRKISTRYFDKVTESLLPPLKEFLQTHISPVQEAPEPPPIALSRKLQLKIIRQVITAMGFDFSYGRLDTSIKAFFEKTDQDRRIVTAIDKNNFMSGLSSAIHETGHALHHQFLPPEWIDQPVGEAGDFCMREAMAFIWQVFVAQTPQFNTYLTRLLHQTAGLTIQPEQLDKVQNIIRPTPLRIGSDAASYALHIMIRYHIERDLINGTQDVATLPQRWKQDYLDHLNLAVTDDTSGLLQDIHWYKGSFGYFPCYLLAMLYAAQLFHKAKQDIPDLVQGFTNGHFAPLVQWLRDKVYSQANFYDGPTLLELATGEPLNPHYFIDYLQTRYKVETKTA